MRTQSPTFNRAARNLPRRTGTVGRPRSRTPRSHPTPIPRRTLTHRATAAATYVWSAGGAVYVDALILRNRDTDANGSLDERLYVTQDANFNVTALTDTTGAVQARFVYDAHFKRLDLAANFTESADSLNWVVGAQGLARDENTGLWYARNRWYSDSLMVWITVDPIRDGMNWYQDHAGNPINRVDPSGLEHLPAGWVGDEINGYQGPVQSGSADDGGFDVFQIWKTIDYPGSGMRAVETRSVSDWIYGPEKDADKPAQLAVQALLTTLFYRTGGGPKSTILGFAASNFAEIKMQFRWREVIEQEWIGSVTTSWHMLTNTIQNDYKFKAWGPPVVSITNVQVKYFVRYPKCGTVWQSPWDWATPAGHGTRQITQNWLDHDGTTYEPGP